MKRIQFLTQEDLAEFSDRNNIKDLEGVSIVDKQVEKDLTTLIFYELRKVKDDDRSLVILSNSFFELVVNHLIKKQLKTQKNILKDNRTYSYSVKLTILYELGIIRKSEFDRLNILRKERNKYSHQPFIDENQSTLKRINALGSNTYFILTFFIVEIWNKHVEQLKDLNERKTTDTKPKMH